MSANNTSTNPIVQAVVSGAAPPQARMAAARGLLPVPQDVMLELLVALRADADADISRAADETLAAQETSALLGVASEPATATSVLTYLASRPGLAREVQESLALNASTPDEAVAALARATSEGAVLDLVAVNQQRLIRAPSIIDAVLANPARTADAERRVRETRREFFEKERGAQQVADEMRARGWARPPNSSSRPSPSKPVRRASASTTRGSSRSTSRSRTWTWTTRGSRPSVSKICSTRPSSSGRPRPSGSSRRRAPRPAAAPERVALIRRIMLMKVKDRIKLGMKGDREARSILIRDPNKVVAQAVINNPRITDQEVEAIAAMRTVSDEVLRLIAMNRGWARQYPIIHNLARNPRTPLPTEHGTTPAPLHQRPQDPRPEPQRLRRRPPPGAPPLHGPRTVKSRKS